MPSSMGRVIPGRWPAAAPVPITTGAPLRRALQGLGAAMTGPATAPNVDFQQALRRRLVIEAAPRATPTPALPSDASRPWRQKRPKGGGIRLTAFGIGLSLAGGAIAAAAYSFSLPAPVAAPGAPLAHHASGPPEAARGTAATANPAGSATLPARPLASAPSAAPTASPGASANPVHGSGPLPVESVAPALHAVPAPSVPLVAPSLNDPASDGLLATAGLTPEAAGSGPSAGVAGSARVWNYPPPTPSPSPSPSVSAFASPGSPPAQLP